MLRKQSKKKDKYSSNRNEELLATVRAQGDRRSELALLLTRVASDARSMHQALDRIYDTYEADGLHELADEAERHFPVDLAVSIEKLEYLFDEIYEGVEHVSSESSDLVKRISTYISIEDR
jgi:uncharacterized coiled-coil DUF342 family protein